MINILFLDYNI